MNTFNCSKPSHGSGKLPPFPKRISEPPSLKSTITSCGINSACPTKSQLNRNGATGDGQSHSASKVPGISFPYDSVSLTRDLFRGFLLRARDSLTIHERNFLEDLVEDGQEHDLNNAMLVLSDRNIFFHPKQWSLEKSTSHFFGCPSTTSRDDSVRSKEEEDETIHRDECSTVSSPSKNCNKENFIEFNVEVVSSEHGVVILEGSNNSCTSVDGDSDYDAAACEENGEKNNAAYPDMRNNITPKPSFDNDTYTLTTPTATTAVTPKTQNRAFIGSPRSRSVPQSISSRLGTPHRRQRLEERRQSIVHSSMWKAHKQGLHLTPASSFQSVKDLNRILSLKRRTLSGQRGGSPNPIFGRRSRNGSRAGSRTSSPIKFLDNVPMSGNKGVRSFHQRQQKYEHAESLSSLPSLRHAHQLKSRGDSIVSDTDYDSTSLDEKSHNATFGNKMSSSTLGSDSISERDYGLSSSTRVSFPRLDIRDSDYFDSSMSSIPGLDLAHSIHSGTFATSYHSRKGNSPLRRASQDSFRSNLNFGASFLDQEQKHLLHSYQNVDLDQESLNVDESLQSFPSLHHGRSIDDSIQSIPTTIYPSELSEDTSNLSISSSRPLMSFRRQSSQWSRASSVTLNSLPEPYELEQVISNVSATSTTSLRHKAPIRPTRNPSPLVSRPKMVQRAMSDGVLPPRRDVGPKDDVSKNATTSTRAKLLTKRNSLASRFDVLETIESVDERNAKHHDDDDDSFFQAHKYGHIKQKNVSSLVKPMMIRKASEGNDNGCGVEISGINGKSNSTFEDMKRSSHSDFIRIESPKSCQSPHSVHSESAVHLLESMEKLHSLLDASEDDELTVESGDHYDSWHVLLEDDENDFNFAFKILGTSADDVASTPHVLSPPLMESLRHFLPYAVSEQNFFMKYSLLRDGASFISLLQNVRGSTHTLLALETTDGEVFGSFTSAPWRKHTSYFGSGECFLWRMKKDRKTLCKSVLDQAILESDIEVFAWTGANYLTQLCTDDKIALGGGSANGEEGGFGLIIEANLLIGQTNRCATFGNPPLSNEHQDGSSFEIVNLEIWTMTPCNTEEDALKLELGKLFLEANRVEH
mmetsp:Transcript_2858/g.5351  ORF Transcript_2858/g.5351 Transcript_2858/m.5351 type:complete len:1091 (+) Transcript_2858:104-3376(+)